MPRPSLSNEKRRELIPIVARAFAELGYRRTTTAELAKRCAVRENILYRLWPDKKGMFIAAINYVYDLSATTWRELLAVEDDGQTAAERILAYESRHQGEFGNYRIIFAGLSESDDPDIRDALAGAYRRYQRLIRQQIAAHRGDCDRELPVNAGLAAWGIIGLATMANIAREFGLLGDRQRRRLVGEVGHALLDGQAVET